MVVVCAVNACARDRDIYPVDDRPIFKVGVIAPAGQHNILSVVHPDTAVSAAARGSLLVRNSNSKWARLSLGTSGTVLRSDGTDTVWAATTNITTLGTIVTGVWNATAIDISSYTNLIAGTNITLSSDTLNVDDAFLVNDANDEITGILTAAAFVGDITGDITGNADTATALATGRTIDMTGDVVWTSPAFDGSANVTAAGTIQANAVALTTDTTGNYAAGDGEAGNALAGDSATAFFSAGTIEHEYGGLEANVSAYTGLLAISDGNTSEIDALSELEAQIADVTAFVVEGTACSDIEGVGLSITDGTLNWAAVADSVTLTTHTAGNYVASITNGAGISGGDGGSEEATLTLSVDGILEDLDTLGAPTADGEFIVATGAGVFAYETANTARTSLELGTGDTPVFDGLTITNQVRAEHFLSDDDIWMDGHLLTIGGAATATDSVLYFQGLQQNVSRIIFDESALDFLFYSGSSGTTRAGVTMGDLSAGATTILSTDATQFSIQYNASNKADFSVSEGGILSVTPSGIGTVFYKNFLVDEDFSVSGISGLGVINITGAVTITDEVTITGDAGTTGNDAPDVLTVTGGIGGSSVTAESDAFDGADIIFTSGTGGNSSEGNAGDGGDIELTTGAPGLPGGGSYGNLILLKNGGDVGIGTTTSDTKLQVVGDCKFGDDNTNYVEASTTGDVVFVGSSGLAFGEIYVKDNAVAMTLNSAAKVQVTIFGTDGQSNNTTPDHTNDHITITKAGMYLVTISTAVQNNAAQSHKIVLSLWKNNGATEFTNVHAHRNLSGGSTDVGSISLSGIVDVAVNDTLEVWADTSAAADRSITVEDITLSIVQVGGT